MEKSQPQPTFTWSNFTVKTPEHCVKFGQS